jgi:hypothetical protein
VTSIQINNILGTRLRRYDIVTVFVVSYAAIIQRPVDTEIAVANACLGFLTGITVPRNPFTIQRRPEDQWDPCIRSNRILPSLLSTDIPPAR